MILMKYAYQRVFTTKVGKFWQKSQSLPGFLLAEMLISLGCLMLVITSFLLLYSYTVALENNLILKLDALMVALRVINTLPATASTTDDRFEVTLEQHVFSRHFKTVLVRIINRTTKEQLIELATGYYVP